MSFKTYFYTFFSWFLCALVHGLISTDALQFKVLGAVETRYESNLFRNATNGVGAWAVILSPGAHLFLKTKENPNYLSLLFREDIYIYRKYSSVNHQNANVFINSLVEAGCLNLQMNASFQQLADNTPDLTIFNQLIRSQRSYASLLATYSLTSRLNVQVGPNFEHVNYRTQMVQLKDKTAFTIPINFYYLQSEKTAYGPSYWYRQIDLPKESAFKDNFFGFAWKGQLSECACAELAVGALSRSKKHTSTHHTAGGQGKFIWKLNPCTKIKFCLNRDWGTTAFGLSTLGTSSNINVDYMLNPYLTISPSVGLGRTRYQERPRRDTFKTAGISLGISLPQDLQARIEYVAQRNASNLADARFDNHSIGFKLYGSF